MSHDSAMGSAGLPAMTIEEWADLDEDEPGELVDGRLEEEEEASYLHEAVVAWLIGVLGAWAAARSGWVFGLGTDGRYAIALTASEGAHPVPGCEGLTLDLDSLWAELDRLLGAGEPPH
jgi:hypothetical protein